LARNMSVREEMRAVTIACENIAQQLHDDSLLYEAELALEATGETVERRGNIWLCGNGPGFCLALETATRLAVPTSRFELSTRANVLGLNGALSSATTGRTSDDYLGAELLVYGRRGVVLWCFASDCASNPLLYALMKANEVLKIPVVLFSEYPGTPLTRFSDAKIRIQTVEGDDRSGYCIQWAHSFIANVLCNQLKRLSKKVGG